MGIKIMADTSTSPKPAQPMQKVRTFAEDVKRVKELNGEIEKTPDAIKRPELKEEITNKTTGGKFLPIQKIPEEIKTKDLKKLSETDINLHKEKIAEDEVSILLETPEHLPEYKKSILGDDDEHVFDDRDASGTIITDTKYKRWTFGKAIKDATREWAGDVGDSIGNLVTDATPPKTVHPASSRVDIISAAGKESNIAPQDDHKVVLERLRTLERDATKETGKPFVIKKKEETPPATWTHTKKKAPEIISPLEEEIVEEESSKMVTPPQNVPHTTKSITDVETPGVPKKRVEIKPEELETGSEQSIDSNAHSEETPMIVALPSVPHSNISIDEMRTQNTPVRTEKSTPSIHERNIYNIKTEGKEILPQDGQNHIHVDAEQFVGRRQQNIPTVEKAPREPVSEETADEIFEKQVEAVPETRQEPPTSVVEKLRELEGQPKELPRKSSYLRPALILISIVVFVSFISGGTLYYLSTQSVEVNTSNAIVSLVETKTQISVPLSNDRKALLTSLRNTAKGAPQGIVQLYPTVTDDGLVPAKAGDILSTLAFRMPGAFTRSISEITIGSNNAENINPFIIIRSSNFDTSFAGMLAWETSMSADLAPFFGEPVRRSLEHNIRNIDQTIVATFVDSVSNNRDVRILRDENGTEQIIYTFINQQTIVITKNQETLKVLVESL